MKFILFYLLVVTGSFFLIKKKSNLQVFFIIFSSFMVFNLIVHSISINLGKDGYSIFTKDILKDETIYYGEAKDYYLKIKRDGISGFYSNSDKAILGKNYYSFVILMNFLLFNTSDIILARVLTALFYAMFFVQIHRFVQLINLKDRIYLSVFLILLYPTLTIRGLQIEQEMLVNLIFVSLINKLINFDGKSLLFHYASIFYLKIIGFVALIASKLNKKLSVNLSFIIQFFMLPVVIIKLISIISPATFKYVVAVKSYIVMDGKNDFFDVDYNSVFGIIKTTIISWYYYLFAPLTFRTVVGGSFPFKVLLIEPIFLFFGLFYIFKNKTIVRQINNITVISYFLFYYSLIYILGESHVTSFMRRRIILYIFIFMVLQFIKSKKTYSFKF